MYEEVGVVCQLAVSVVGAPFPLRTGASDGLFFPLPSAAHEATAGAGAGTGAGAGVVSSSAKKRARGEGGAPAAEVTPEEARLRAMSAFLKGAVVDVVVRHARNAIPNNAPFLLSLVAVVDDILAGRNPDVELAAGSRAGTALGVDATLPAAHATLLLGIANRLLADVKERFPSVRGVYERRTRVL